MAIVDEHVTTQGNGSEVIDAARSVGNIAHDYSQGVCKPIDTPSTFAPMPKIQCAPLDDICDSASKHLESLRHLESDHGCVILSYMMYGFVNLKRIIWRDLLNSSIKLDVVEDILRYLAVDRRLHPRF